jgi:putative colanic acid biosynthesis UDP-glucose lipid carrier transferase
MKPYFYQGRLALYSRWIDLVLLNVLFLVAYWTRFPGALISEIYLILLLSLNLCWLRITYFFETYSVTRQELSIDELLRRFMSAVLVLTLVITSLLFFTQYGEQVSRLMLGVVIGSFALVGGATRALILKWLQVYRTAGHNVKGFMMAGNCEMGQLLQARYEQRLDLGLRYRGTFEFGMGAIEQELERLEYQLEANTIDYLYCCMSSLSVEQVQGIINLGERHRVQIRLVPDFRGFLSYQSSLEYHDVVPVIEVSTKPYSNVRDENYKRAFDLMFSLVVVVGGAPVFFGIALLVKVFSPGPVFFRQERTGRWGQRFYIYKFRSMYADADRLGLKHSMGELDPRITLIGRILRKTRLDELPQFLNVIKGDMSVVGPRPLFQYDVDMLIEAAPDHFKRLLTVKPGITSIGQLKVGYADSLSLNLIRMRYDLLYLRKYSVWLDLYLIAQTIKLMIAGKGK